MNTLDGPVTDQTARDAIEDRLSDIEDQDEPVLLSHIERTAS